MTTFSSATAPEVPVTAMSSSLFVQQSSSSSSAIAEMEQWFITTTMGNHGSSSNGSDRSTPASTTAHIALQLLRDSGDDQCLFLRTIIEFHHQQQQEPHQLLSDHQTELLFHCILGCRHVILGKWEQSYSRQFLHRLRDYFMISAHSLPVYTNHRPLRMSCYTTAAAFWKRMWITIETSSHVEHPLEARLLADMSSICSTVVLSTPDSLFSYLNALMVQQQQQQMKCGVEFLNCIISEFGSKSMAVNYRMPMEFHTTSHRAFETSNALYQSLQLSVTCISHLAAAATTTTTITSPIYNLDVAIAMIQLFNDILGWEFGTANAFTTTTNMLASTSSSSPLLLLRPPLQWNNYIARVDVVSAMFRIHEQYSCTTTTAGSSSGKTDVLLQTIRQTILLLSSISGPIFTTSSEQIQFASAICDGCIRFIQHVSSGTLIQRKEYSTILLDLFQIGSRLVSNFRLSIVLQIPTFLQLLTAMSEMGRLLLVDHVRECESAHGDIESMEYYDWREETIGQLLDCAVLISSDTWLWHTGGTEEAQNSARMILSDILSPLFDSFVMCRTRMASLEEMYQATNESDLDEVREGITEIALNEGIDSIAALGRLNVMKSISCLSSLCGSIIPQLHSLWEGDGDATPEISALLEESNLLILFISHLLTDNNEGESPSIPDAIMISCLRNDTLTANVASAVHVLLRLAEVQIHKIALNPYNQRLSPLLAKTLLSFLNRWAPAYIYPLDYQTSNSSNGIVREWSDSEKAKTAIELCITLCLNYLCYWPQELPVRDLSRKLLRSFAMRSGNIRNLMIASPSFQIMVQCHCIVSGIRHTAGRTEFETIVMTNATTGFTIPPTAMLWGYHRLSYETKAFNLTTILIACSDHHDALATNMINDSLSVIHSTFTTLVEALATKQVNPDNPDVRETACLCVDLFGGLAQASEMSSSERIPQFVSNYLPQLSNLMTYYANDTTVCETLLRFFRDYTAHFISVLDREQSLVLFRSSAELLRSYSVNHWSSRTITKKSQTEQSAEEEQAYSDITCSIQLLVNLGTKDFIDVCSSNEGVDSTQVTDVIFYGLQQILPLMTQGLLQFPTLCLLFFELVGFMVDTYPEKLCALPLELFDSLLESLLFGMCHHDAIVAKHSIQGVSSICREHLSSGVLKAHLDRRPDILDECSKRLILEVVYQPIVMDRMEATGMAILYLSACDVNRFANVVQELSLQISNQQQKERLDIAYTKLIQPDVLAKAGVNGYEGRTNRVAFRKSFELFVNEIHSFLVLR